MRAPNGYDNLNIVCCRTCHGLVKDGTSTRAERRGPSIQAITALSNIIGSLTSSVALRTEFVKSWKRGNKTIGRQFKARPRIPQAEVLPIALVIPPVLLSLVTALILYH